MKQGYIHLLPYMLKFLAGTRKIVRYHDVTPGSQITWNTSFLAVTAAYKAGGERAVKDMLEVLEAVAGTPEEKLTQAAKQDRLLLYANCNDAFRNLLLGKFGRLPLGFPPNWVYESAFGAEWKQAIASRTEDSPLDALGEIDMLGNIGVHPQALEAYDNGTLPKLVEEKIKEIDAKLDKIVREQLAAGFINVQIKLRSYVGLITGLTTELDALADHAGGGTDEVMAVHRHIRELDKKLDYHVEQATRRLDMLKTSPDLETHVAIVLGCWDELQERASDPDAVKRRLELKARVEERAAAVADEPVIKDTLAKIKAMRVEVARQVGIKNQIEDLSALTEKIRKQLFSRGFRTGKELYVQTLSQGLGLFAMAFHGKAVLYRTTDFKSNEYRNLLGGNLFEAHEDNPMLGYRGVSRNIHDWEIESFKLARGIFGGKNLNIMEPRPAASRLPERASKKTVGRFPEGRVAATASRRCCSPATRVLAACCAPVKVPMRSMAVKSPGKSWMENTATGTPRVVRSSADVRASSRPESWSTRSGFTASTRSRLGRMWVPMTGRASMAAGSGRGWLGGD